MKKSYLTILALAALGFAACTDSESVVDPTVVTNGETPDNAINFTSYLGGALNTRAGYNGSINTDVLKKNATNDGTQVSGDGANGFGVFAYYTGNYTYGQYMYGTYTSETGLATDATSAQIPNFMYNQQVTYNEDNKTAGYITGWTYSPLKYWPNDIAGTNGPVDDQEDDANNKQATGSNAYGGNVSFFAYAPYVEVAPDNGTPTSGKANYNDGTDVGITGLTSNVVTGDPKVTYVLYKAASGGNPAKLSNVDLLWGTYNGTTQNVVGAGNAGVAYDNTASDNTYKKAILPHKTGEEFDGYKLNADLTKQTTNGTIGFAFKHALAGLGGGKNVSSGIGFQVVLDIDDLEGAEQGDERESFTVSSTDDAYRTIVTIKSIEISNDLDADGSIGEGEVGQPLSGKLNLATGQWEETTSTGVVAQTVGTVSDGNSYHAELSQKIAEYKTNTTTTIIEDKKSDTDYTPYFKKDYTSVNDGDHPGVTEVAQNVFNDPNQTPLMFIPNGTGDEVLRVTVDYIVRTYDASLKTPFTTVEQIISKKITLPAFELNKHYNLLMHLGLTGVKFTATVDNWDEGTFVDSDGDGNIEESDIYLPRNVAGYTITATTPADAENTANAETTFTATAVCSDPATAQTTTLSVSATGATAEISGNTVTVKFSEANATTTKKSADVTVTAKVGENTVATETVKVYQAACGLTITSPTIVNGETAVNLVVTSPTSDEHSSNITVTAVKEGSSDPVGLTVGTATFNDNKTTIPVTLATAASTGDKYTFTVNINDATGTTGQVMVGSGGGAKRR